MSLLDDIRASQQRKPGGNSLVDAIRADVPWYAPVPQAPGDAAVESTSPPDRAAIADVIGSDARPPQPRVGIADTIDNPNSLANVIKRHEAEKTRLAGEPSATAGSAPEDDWSQIGRKFVSRIAPLFKQSVGGLTQALIESANVPPPNAPLTSYEYAEMQKQLDEGLTVAREKGIVPGQQLYRAATQDLEANGYNIGDSTSKKYATMIADSMVQMVPAIAASIATRNPYVAGAVTAGQVGGQQYGESRENGRDPGQALRDATFMGGAEAIGESIPLGILMKPGGKFLTRALKTAGAEGLQEMFTQVLQTGYDKGVLHPDMTWGEAAQQVVDAGIVGAAMGGGMAVAEAPFHRSAETMGATAPQIAPDVDRAAAQSFSPSTPGIHNIGGHAVEITAEDVASPIPTDLIAKGKAAVSRATSIDQSMGAEPSPLASTSPPGLSPLAEADQLDATLLHGARDPQIVTPPTPRIEPPSVATPAKKGEPVDDAKAITEALFPGSHVTSWHRDEDDPLSRANPTSWHVKSRGAVDVRPIQGMTFEQFVQRYRDEGYSIIEAIDEVKHPSKHATGPHWHVVIGHGNGENVQSADAAPAAPSMLDAIRESQAPERQGTALRGDAIDKDWTGFAPETGTLDVPRADMPQIAAEHRGALVNFLNARGIAHEEVTVPAADLKPTQTEFSTEKVAAAKRFTGGDRAILVSNDGYVLDGHHQWVAAHDQGKEVRAIRLDAPIRELLATVPEMPSATTSSGATSQVRDESTVTAEPAKVEPVQIDEPPADPSPPADTPAASPSPTVETMPTGSSIIVRGADAGAMAAIAAALPKGVKPIPNAKLGGMVFAKKHERAVRAALQGETRRNTGFRDRRQDTETDLLTFIAANGGIRDDEDHDLRKGRGLQRFVPGQGAVIRKDGKSVDGVRERLEEAGWLLEGSTVADTLNLIERAHRAPLYHPASDRIVAAQTDGKESEDEARARIKDAIAQIGLRDIGDDDISRALTFMSDGDTADVAIFSALDERYAREAEEFSALADDADYDIPGFDDVQDTLPDAERPRRGEKPTASSPSDGEGREQSRPDAAATRARESEPGATGRDPEPSRSVEPAAAAGEALYDEDGQQIGWLDGSTGVISGMTDDQRSEMAARLQQSTIRRGGQEAISEQAGGLFDAARDQGALFSRTEPVATITGDELGVEFRGDEDFHDLIVAAVSWYRKNLVGRTITMFDGVPVTFSSRGLRETTHNKGDILLRLVPAIPDILRNGYLMQKTGGDRPNIRSIMWIAGKVDFIGKEMKVAVAVREHTDGVKRQYTLTRVDWFHDVAGGRPSRTDGDASIDPDKNAPPAGVNIRLLEAEAKSPAAANIDGLSARMRQLGLTDRVALEAADRFEQGSIAGSYKDRVISVALASSQNAIDTLNHEAVHALRDLGLFRAPEWRSLEAAARADKPMMGSVRQRYPDLTADQQLEEAVADRFMRWAKGNRERGFIASAFDRVRDFVRALGHALRGQGFTTAEGVMRAIEKGKVGARGETATQQVRTKWSMPSVADIPKNIFFRPEVTDAPDFKRWFEGSKVTFNDRKTPLVMFHGTSRSQGGDAFTMFDTYASNYGLMGMGGYFTADPEVASSYTRKGRGDTPTVYPVYLSIKNPIDMDAAADPAQWAKQFEGIEEYHEGGTTNESWYRAAENLIADDMIPRWEGAEIMQDALRAMGHDGITHIGGGRVAADGIRHRVFVAFDPEQIKSATGNSGAFDAQTSDIRYSIVGAIQSVASGPTSARFHDAMDRWRTALQDRYLPLLRTQQTVEQQLGRPLAEDENPYLAEELMSGRIGARLQQLADDTVEPLLAAIHAEDVTVAELEEYLYARHAPERNARIAKINQTFQQGEGSGMTDAEAAQVIADVDAAGKRPAMDRLAARVDKMLADALQTRVDGGLMSQADANLWKQQYQSYVPLRGRPGAGAGLSGRVRQQSGISVKGKESRRAFGRESKADSILAYAVLQAEEAIVRSEKNRVAKSFLDLATAAPAPAFWRVDKIERRAVFNKTTGLVEYQNQSRISAEDAPYTVSAKVDGVEHRVTMNRDDPAAARLAASMRNLNEQQVEFVVKYLGAVNRFLSTVNTSYNPEFLITNAFRDIQTATVNLSAERANMVSGTLKDYRAALAASVKGSFGKGSGPWDQWYRDFVMDGGRTFFNNVEDLDAIKRRLSASMKLASDRAAGRLSVKRGFFAAREIIENLNNGVENAIRLSAYKNAREVGMSRKQAASLAKNLTVNFNRRGTFGPLVNSLYLFFNASVQGTARLMTAMKSPRVRKIMLGVMVSSAMLELLNAMMSDDDDDGESYYDKISAFDKARNLIIMIPGTKGEHIKIPLPYGYNVFANAGRTMAEIMRRGGDRWQQSASEFVGSVADAFNPIGGTQSLLNFLAPTIADPVVDLTLNRDFADKPIMPDENQFGPKEPDAQRYFSSVGAHWKAVTDGLTAMTGGNDVVPGAIDVSPETLEYLSGVFFGAAGSFVDRAGGLMTKTIDGEVTENDIPFVRKLIGGKPAWYDKAAYYDRVGQVEQAISDAKELRDRGMTDAFDSFVTGNESLIRMEAVTKAAKKRMRDIRKAKNQSERELEMGVIDDKTAADDRERIRQAETVVIDAYNARWNEIVLGAKPKPTK